MLSFLVHLGRLFIDLGYGVKEDPEFRALLLLLVTLLFSATLFYWQIEGWSVIDSLYFSVMTMSTIGYGDFHPTTTLSKLFTIIYALLSIGVFVAVVSKLVEVILKRKKIRAEKHRQHKEARRAANKKN